MVKLEKVEINYGQEFFFLISSPRYVNEQGCEDWQWVLFPVFLCATREEIFCCCLKYLLQQQA